MPSAPLSIPIRLLGLLTALAVAFALLAASVSAEAAEPEAPAKSAAERTALAKSAKRSGNGRKAGARACSSAKRRGARGVARRKRACARRARQPASSRPTRPATPATAPASLGTGFEPGLNSGTYTQLDPPAAAKLGARQVRVHFLIGTPASVLAQHVGLYADRGIRMLPLAGFKGRIPTPEEARNLAEWAKAYGPGGTFWAGRSDGHLAIRSIEFGNETSYGYQYGDSNEDASYFERAKSYALRFRDARRAIDASGAKVGLLAQADDWSGRWVEGMYAAVPGFHELVDGWTVHPYGARGAKKLADTLRFTAAHGAPSSIPIDITEWGIATDDGRCLSDNYGLDKCMSYAAAAATTRSHVAQIRSTLGSRLRSFIFYHVRDHVPGGATNDRESYFGALKLDSSEKGEYTAEVRAVLQSGR